MNHHHSKENAFNHNLFSDDSLEEFHRQFEYKPLQPPASYKTLVQAASENQVKCDNEDKASQPYITDEYESDNRNENPNENELDEDYYYRTKSRMILKRLHNVNEIQTIVSNSSESNFQQLQNESNLRKIKNDYKIREGDQIYNKYFTDDLIDPEVKELWESRKDKLQDDVSSEFASNRQNVTISRIKGIIKSRTACIRTKKEVGFHVDRPKVLVVKTIDQINQEKEQRNQQQQHQQQHQQHQQQEEVCGKESILSSASSISLI